MFESIGRSWEIAKLSFNVVKSDKEMLLFPLLAGIFSLLFIVAMVFPTIITGFLISGLDESVVDLAIYAILFLVYLGLAAIATFFNVCVVYTTKKRFEGGDSKFFEAIGFAFSRLPVIIAWAIVSATVGIILNILSSQAEKMGAVGQIVMKIFVSLLGAAWGILTIFVVPSLVYENVGPFEAIKKSASVLKKTWGESLTRHLKNLGRKFNKTFCTWNGTIYLPICGFSNWKCINNWKYNDSSSINACNDRCLNIVYSWSNIVVQCFEQCFQHSTLCVC